MKASRFDAQRRARDNRRTDIGQAGKKPHAQTPTSSHLPPPSGLGRSGALTKKSVSFVDRAAEVARGQTQMIELRTKGPKTLETVTEGRLVRETYKNKITPRIITPEGKGFCLSPKDAFGIPDGGRVRLVKTGGRLSLDAELSDRVRAFVGTVEKRAGRLWAVSDDPKAPFDGVILEEGTSARPGQSVLVHVENALRPERHGQVRETFEGHEHWKKNLSALATRMGVEATYSDEELSDVDRIVARFDPDRIEGYEDFTDKFCFSLDNPYSVDFDQAYAVEPNPDNPGWTDVYYALADLNYFLDLAGPDSALRERCDRMQTTTYMPGFDFPVLPRILSENLISLVQDEKRPAFVVKWTLDENGKVHNPSFHDAVVRVKKNSNYPVAQKHLDGDRVKDPEFARNLDLMLDAGARMLGQANDRGMVTSGQGETWATLNSKTGELETEHRGHLHVEQLNAQFSITANELIFDYLQENGAPAYHRRHDNPDVRRIDRAKQIVGAIGVPWPEDEDPREVLRQLDLSTPVGQAARRLILRALPRAYVSSDPGLHHGLALKGYDQSTAPMRRTRDAKNHDAVRRVRDGRPPSSEDQRPIVQNANAAEERSRRIDREVRSRIAAKVLNEHAEEQLEANVTSISPRFGVDLSFPALGVEVTIPLSDLPGQSPHTLADGGARLLSKDGLEVRLGQVVPASVVSTNPFEGEVELSLSLQKAKKTKKKKQSSGPLLDLGAVFGDGFQSPHVGRRVETSGVVTAKNGVGFFVEGIGDSAAGGVLVRSRNAAVEVGQVVNVSGRVREKTERDAPYDRSVVDLVECRIAPDPSQRADLPPVVEIGGDGLPMPPADPKEATEYWRKLLGRRVRIAGGTAVSPSNRFGDLVMLPDGWAPEGAARTPEGGVVMPHGVYNHQSISLKFREHLGQLPNAGVGARLDDLEGVVIYRSGAFQVELTRRPEITPAPKIAPTPTSLVGNDHQLTLASLNALNLHPGARERAMVLARQIVRDLKCPDVIALQEIQDNDGPEVSDVTDASETYRMLIELIRLAGGPEYEWCDIPPENGKDGGEPGGNIRPGYLYKKDRVKLEHLERIGEDDPDFEGTRKPLAARFDFKGKKLLVVNDHLTSRRGSSPWTSDIEEPVIGGHERRVRQAQKVRAYTDSATSDVEGLDVLVVGDSNDWPGSETYSQLTAGTFWDASALVPADKRFDYNFRGTLQLLQAPVASGSLDGRLELEFLHKSVYTPIEGSDHDPLILRVDYGSPLIELP